MNIDPSTIIGSGAFGFIVLIGEYPKRAAKHTRKNPLTKDNTFVKECEALKNIHHPNIVQFFGFKDEGNYNVIEMEYCERNSLFEVLNDPSIVYSMKTAICWAKQLFDALLCLQQLGIVHRDIKPNNVLVTRDFILKLADFGCVRPVNVLTTVSLAGTYRYMSPEAYGYPEARLVTVLTDLYSMGLVLWEIIERRAVYSRYAMGGFSDYALFYDLWHEKYKLEEVDCADEELKKLVASCTNVRPDDRPRLDEGLEIVQRLNDETKKEPFEPLIIETQTVLLRPIGFNGTKDWVPVNDLVSIHFPSISIHFTSTNEETNESPKPKDVDDKLIQEKSEKKSSLVREKKTKWKSRFRSCARDFKWIFFLVLIILTALFLWKLSEPRGGYGCQDWFGDKSSKCNTACRIIFECNWGRCRGEECHCYNKDNTRC